MAGRSGLAAKRRDTSGLGQMTVSLLVQPRLNPLRSSSGGLATFAAMRRASSRVWLTERPPGDDSIAVGD